MRPSRRRKDAPMPRTLATRLSPALLLVAVLSLVWANPATAAPPPLAWLTLGDAGTDPAVHFLGTTDNQPLVVRTNNVERLRVLADGPVQVRGTLTVGQARIYTVGADNSFAGPAAG